MAACIATILLSISASFIRDSAKYCVYESVGDFDLNCFPDLGSNFTTPVEEKNYQYKKLSLTFDEFEVLPHHAFYQLLPQQEDILFLSQLQYELEPALVLA